MKSVIHQAKQSACDVVMCGCRSNGSRASYERFHIFFSESCPKEILLLFCSQKFGEQLGFFGSFGLVSC